MEEALAMDQPVSQPERPTSARKQLADELERRRKQVGLKQRELAARIGFVREYVTQAEGQGTIPSEHFIRRAGEVIGGTERLLELRDQAVDEQATKRVAERGRKTPAAPILLPRQSAQSVDALVRSDVRHGSVTVIGGDTLLVELGGRGFILNRRELFKSGLALSGAALANAPLQLASPGSADGEEARRGMEHVLAPALGDRDIDEWERTAHAYGYEVGSVAPDRLLPSLLADFSEAADLLSAPPPAAVKPRLTSVAGRLSALTAMTFVNLGQPQTARRWWRTARRIANQAADGKLAAFVRGRQAVLALYGGYTPTQVLALADEAVAVGVPCTGVTSGLAARTQALAIMGNAEAARETMETLAAMFDRLPDATKHERTSVSGWSEQKLRHVQSYVHTRLGETKKAAKAQQQALALYPATNYQGPTQVHLHRAACLIMDGHVTEGVHYATEVLAALPTEYRNDGLVQGSAHSALVAVPHSDRSLAPVAEYRELLSPTSAAHRV